MKETQFFDRDLTYREALLEAALTLKYFIDNLEDRIFDIALTRELKPWIASVPNDENHEIEVFEACNDKNITRFVKLSNEVRSKKANYMNQNNMDEEELKNYEKFKFDSYWKDYDDSNDPPAV